MFMPSFANSFIRHKPKTGPTRGLRDGKDGIVKVFLSTLNWSVRKTLSLFLPKDIHASGFQAKPAPSSGLYPGVAFQEPEWLLAFHKEPVRVFRESRPVLCYQGISVGLSVTYSRLGTIFQAGCLPTLEHCIGHIHRLFTGAAIGLSN